MNTYIIIVMNIKSCADDIGVSHDTVRNWITGKIKSVVLPAVKKGVRGEYFIDPVDWNNFCSKYGYDRRDHE
jgi:hypothetical protein